MFYSGLSKLFTSKNTPEHKLFPIPNGKSKKSINKRTEWLRAISIEGNQSVDLSVSDIFSKVGPCMNQQVYLYITFNMCGIETDGKPAKN